MGQLPTPEGLPTVTHQHLTDPTQKLGALKIAEAIDKLDDKLVPLEQVIGVINMLTVPLDLDSPELTVALTSMAITRGLLLKFALDMGHAGGEISSEDYAETVAKAVMVLRGLTADFISAAQTVQV